MIGAYRRIKLQYLSEELEVDTDLIEKYLMELIFEGEIHGKINEVEGYFENEDLTINKKEQACLFSINNWLKNLPDQN